MHERERRARRAPARQNADERARRDVVAREEARQQTDSRACTQDRAHERQVVGDDADIELPRDTLRATLHTQRPTEPAELHQIVAVELARRSRRPAAREVARRREELDVDRGEVPRDQR